MKMVTHKHKKNEVNTKRKNKHQNQQYTRLYCTIYYPTIEVIINEKSTAQLNLTELCVVFSFIYLFFWLRFVYV